MTEPTQTEGQVDSGTSTEITQATPDGENGQSVASNQTTHDGLGSTETFYDPKELPEEMQPIYKSMQSAFTKRMQDAAKSKDKIAAYDRFASDPMGTMRQMAQQYGFNLVQGNPQASEKWEPQTWEDVMSKAEEVLRPKILKELEPVLNEFRTIKKQTIEQQLSSIDQNWRVYEDDMMQNLNEHPTLVKNPEMLYRMSVPAHVIESQALKKAKQKLEQTVQGGQLSGGSRTTKQPSNKLPGNPTFEQAVEAAKAQLASEGIRPGI